MITTQVPASTATDERLLTRRRFVPRRFYVGMALFMTTMVIVGFWPSYYGPLLRGAAERPGVIHLHGAVFIGWMALLVAQVTLVATGRTRLHRTLGTFGIAYGVLVFVMGVVVSFAAPIIHVAAREWDMDQAAGFLLIPLGDMILFGGFFGAAVWYRRRPEVHKRLILLATVALLFAAAGRMTFAPPRVMLLVWLSPVMVAMGYDAVTRRRVHPTYITGVVVLFVGAMRVLLAGTEAWLGIGRALLRGLTGQAA